MEKDDQKRFAKKPRYRVTRKDDGKVVYGSQIFWIEWNDNNTAKKLHDEPAEGYSLIVDPYFGEFTWLTTQIVEVIKKTPRRILFKTKNSTYLLSDRHGKREG